jgi:MFS family permease
MMFTQSGSAIVALGLAALAFGGVTHVWPIYALAAVGAAVSTFDLPARQALVPTLVPREHLPNAIGLNATMMQTASVAGPSLAGILIATTGGVGWVYMANAVSFGFVIIALLAMRDMPARQPSEGGSRDDVSLHAALEGLRFVFRSPLIRSTMLLDFFATFFSSATALLPIFAQDILHVGASGYGWLYAAPAVGAVVAGAAMVPLNERIKRRGPTLLWAVAGYGLATVIFGVSRTFWLTFFCLATYYVILDAPFLAELPKRVQDVAGAARSRFGGPVLAAGRPQQPRQVVADGQGDRGGPGRGAGPPGRLVRLAADREPAPGDAAI